MTGTATEKPSITFKYHPGQFQIYKDTARRRVVAKGRRWGFTRGTAQFVIQSMLKGITPVLWGDTIVSNIHSYFERYFLPVLSQLPAGSWTWKKTEKKLFIGKSVCDFRSADKPENWEGFGYKLIVLNEAGIILDNANLWNNSVRPMLMDYPDSVAIIGGTPKGRNTFYDLWLKGESGEDDWKSFTFDSYSNPAINKAEIDKLIDELPESTVRQEIYAEFTDEASMVLIPHKLIMECVKRQAGIDSINASSIWGVDVGRQGDLSVLAKRKWKIVEDVIPIKIADTMQVASFINHEYYKAARKPVKIFIEVTGMGWGVYDRCKELGLPVVAADVSKASVLERCNNKRTEMYVRLLEDMEQGLKLPDEPKLIKQLGAQVYAFDSKSRIALIKKEMIKDYLGESPDYSDAVALTYYEDVTAAVKSAEKIQVRRQKRSWLEA